MLQKITQKTNMVKDYLFPKKFYNKKGFTLIELIIVIAIIGILVAAAMMNMGRSTEDSKIARAKEDVRNILAASVLYYNDNGKAPKDCDELTTGTTVYMKTCPHSPWDSDPYTFGTTDGKVGVEGIKISVESPSGIVVSSDDLSKTTTK